MLRLAAVILAAVLVTFPVAALPAPPVTWVAGAALAVAVAGVALLSVSVVTAGASLALIAYALALVIARPEVDPVAAIALGTTGVVFLALVHFASRTRGAALGPAVLAGQIRRWLVSAGLGVVVAGALITVATALEFVIRGATLPMVVVAAALGAVLAIAALVALVTAGAEPAGRR
jgi:hypothetical protein